LGASVKNPTNLPGFLSKCPLMSPSNHLLIDKPDQMCVSELRSASSHGQKHKVFPRRSAVKHRGVGAFTANPLVILVPALLQPADKHCIIDIC
jgi:hypothetical protein